MDSVRLGRVLGVGARLAGKTLAEAIDAATAEPANQRRTGEVVVIPPESDRRRGASVREQTGARVVRKSRATATGVRRGGRRFGEAVWGPMARASGVLWLEVTGVFFGLVAVAGVDGMWRYRGGIHWESAARDLRLHFAAAAVLAVAFGYFCLSSFVAATRRSRT